MHAEPQQKWAKRIHMLYLFASGQVRSRIKAGVILGVERETISRWLQHYAEGGIDQLCRDPFRPHPAPAVTEEAWNALKARLQSSEGFVSYQAMADWLFDTYGITIRKSALYSFVRSRLNVRPKVARPQSEKKTTLRSKNSK